MKPIRRIMLCTAVVLTVCTSVVAQPTIKNEQTVIKSTKVNSALEAIELHHAAAVAFWYATNDAQRYAAWESIANVPNPNTFSDYREVAAEYLADKANSPSCGVILIGCSVAFWDCYGDFPTYVTYETCGASFVTCMAAGNCSPKNPIPFRP